MKSPQRLSPGFTLVEILVAITVIAILAGMLIVGVFPALNRAKETAIQVELSAINDAVEKFKLKFGVYPPSFIRINNANDMLVALNMINRNHREGEVIPGDSIRYVDRWWGEVGINIRPEFGEDLVFWLSGLCKNRQFPLTNGLVGGVVPSAFENDAEPIEREVFAEFKNKQLFNRVSPKVAGYSQNTSAIAPFLYIDAGSYANFLAPGGNTQFTGYWRWTNPPGGDSMTNAIPTLIQVNSRDVVFENPKTFQLIAPGINNLTGGTDYVMGGNIIRYSVEDADNFANFADSRLGEFADSRAGK